MASLNPEDLKALEMQIGDRSYERLGEVMAAGGINNRWLAMAAGIHESQVSRGLNEHIGLDRHWPRIAAALDLSLNWLMFGTGPMSLAEAIKMPKAPDAKSIARELQNKLNALEGDQHQLTQELDVLKNLISEFSQEDPETSASPEQQHPENAEPGAHARSPSASRAADPKSPPLPPRRQA